MCWISYERSDSSKSPNFARDNQNRRSISESGVDSGASDSGLGSHLSQTSLPTASPPASPASFTCSAITNANAGPNTLPHQPPPKSPTLLFHWGAGGVRGLTPPTTPSYIVNQKPTTTLSATSSQSKKIAAVNGKAPTTPPPSLRWGTTSFGFNANAQQPPSSPGPHVLPRSRSHESNLPNRIIKVDQLGATTPSVGTSAKQFILPLPQQYGTPNASPETASIADVPFSSPPFGYSSPTGLETCKFHLNAFSTSEILSF